MNKGNVYFPNLDGLRFFAFLSVFIAHGLFFLGYTNESRLYRLITGHFFNHGDLGVNFFFVLSGFLISYLLLSEKESHGRVGLLNFYMRRVLRIWPVYFITLAIGFFIVPKLQQTLNTPIPFTFNIQPDRLAWYLTFTANYEIIFQGISSVVTTVLWSISVEEQFYFVWPLIIVLCSKRQLKWLLPGIILFSFIFRWLHYYDAGQQHYNTFSVISDLSVGSMCAYLVLNGSRLTGFFEKLQRKHIIMIYLAGFFLFPLRGFSHAFGDAAFMIYCPFERLLFSCFFAFIIMEQNYSVNSFFKMNNNRLCTQLGKYSYGLYCYHMIAIVATLFLFHYFFPDTEPLSFSIFICRVICSFLITVLMAYLSYNFIERHFMSLKVKFSPEKAQNKVAEMVPEN